MSRYHTAYIESPSTGPTYIQDTDKRRLRRRLRRMAEHAECYDSPDGITGAIYWSHDCRVLAEDGRTVIGTDGYPDLMFTFTDSGQIRYATT